MKVTPFSVPLFSLPIQDQGLAKDEKEEKGGGGGGRGGGGGGESASLSFPGRGKEKRGRKTRGGENYDISYSTFSPLL